MKIFSSDEINAIRQYTLREQGITMRQFIDVVGEALAIEIITSLIPGHRLVVFAGPDLNGAYALSVSRYLALQATARRFICSTSAATVPPPTAPPCATDCARNVPTSTSWKSQASSSRCPTCRAT